MSKKDRPRIEAYAGPAGGWGALCSSVKYLLRSHSPLQGVKALLKTNQPQGFDCPGCAWGDAPNSGAVDFCENGVKAVAWENCAERVAAEFFTRYGISELQQRDHYWLERQGRLTEPMWCPAGSDHYRPINWDDAFELIGGQLRALDDPNRALFYTSGRTSNEAAFVYQLMVRLYGTNNFPDCSNMCHEASGVAMAESIGIAKGTVQFSDFEQADAIFVIGQNPGTNHPRMLATLSAASKRGATVVAVNPLRERGLQKFTHPQHPTEMLLGSSTPISRFYLTPLLGGDMALVRGMVKQILIWDRESRAAARPGLLDDGFIAGHCDGYEGYRQVVEQTGWAEIEAQSGLSRADIETAARIYADSERVIITWAMGITQHKHSVISVQEIINLLLLRGNIGKPGAGACPVRGHSNVQGDRTMGIWDGPSPAFLDRLGLAFGFDPPREHGYNTVQAIGAMERGDIDVFIGMGGNFAAATPDTARTERALARCRLTVQISTKLNRSHVVTGEQALILPCLGRSELDRQAGGRQFVTVEDSMSRVHGSSGSNVPASVQLRSEPAIVAGIAKTTVGSEFVDWDWYVADYDRIRDKIEAVVPGFENFNERVRRPHGFYLGNSAAERQWHTETGKARFLAHALPGEMPHQRAGRRTDRPVLTLQTLRSHDQYNTTIYGMDDRYRGVYGQRRVLMMHAGDIRALKFADGEYVDLLSVSDDGVERRVDGFRIVVYDIPRGCCAAYYPETNPLVALESYGDRSFTPTSKAIAVTLQRSVQPAGGEITSGQ